MTSQDEPASQIHENNANVSNSYHNPVYFNEQLENDVIDDANDVIVTVNDTGEMEEEEQNVALDRRSMRSPACSINYDDVLSAEELAEISDTLGEPKAPSAHYLNTRRQSGLMRRRMSRDDTQEEDDEFFHRELILKIRKTLPLKDFKDEIRASRDLEKFLVSPAVLLDCPHRSLSLIFEDLILKLQKDLEPDEKITSAALKTFFTFHHQHEDTVASVDHLRETIQGVRYKPDGASYEATWITALCSLPTLKRSHVGIARLRNPLNLGYKCEEVMFIIAVVAPKKEKFTKNAMEIGRTFASMMLNSSFRHNLAIARTEEDFKDVLILQSSKYKKLAMDAVKEEGDADLDDEFVDYRYWQIGRGVYDDIKRRLPHYWSDYKDGIIGKNTPHKLIATIFFLYFACLLPAIAFGTLYEKSTDGIIDVTSCIVSQMIGGLAFALIGGQPMLILLTTAPLALYVKAIMIVSDTFDLNFRAMYTMTGVWNSIFLILESLFNLSKLMKYSSRSTEEIFGFFIALAFTADAIKATIANFQKNYHFGSINTTAAAVTNTSNTSALPSGCLTDDFCFRPENSILFLFLMLGTLWLGITLLRFDESRFLSTTKREILTDYALPIAVIVLSFFGSYLFQAIPLERFKYAAGRNLFTVPDVGALPPLAHVGAMGLGLCLSCLFFVDQNVSAALVNSPQNKLKKGPAYHWDLMVVGLLNIVFSVFTLPWVHASLPHSPLHVKALADVEQHVSNVGVVHDEIVNVRETRMTGILSHILIGLSLLIIPVLQYVPVAVLQGLFLYIGISAFIGNQMFDRMMLLFTEGSSYPPNHYVRKVPQRKLHLFTICQVLQLVVVSVFGFADLFYLKMIFPVIILLLLPIRHKLLPKIIERKYLAVLDT